MNYRKIKLTQGKYALVDNTDFAKLSPYKWNCLKRGKIFYAGNNKISYMHRFILELYSKDGLMVDHINGNGLDNRRKNLRIATKAENMRNRGVQSNNTSGYKGVHWMKSYKKWEAYIWLDKRKIELGYYTTREEAAAVYNIAAKRLHKNFAFLNNLQCPSKR